MQLKQLERVLYFESYIVTEPGLTPLEKFQLMTEDELLDAQDEYGEDAFTADIGAAAVKTMLMDLDLEQERADLLHELETTKSTLKPKKIIKRLKVVESFIDSGNRPAGRAYLVPEVAALAHRPAARHAVEAARARALFRELHRHRAGPDPAREVPADDRGRAPRRAG
eukprot:GHVR01026405.1.p1 GENE.GHVR01026405.1~~GHVR01026405.1.p1  ORF type:complete len:168 (-),score=27.42 GHVR01026405.1:175-678(-)